MLKKSLSAVAFLIALFLLALHCGPKKLTTSGAVGTHGYIHVFNGSAVGFYTSSGAYALGSSATTSIFQLTQNLGNTQQIAQDPTNGYFYIGTSGCATNCNDVIFMDGFTGFHYANAAASTFPFSSGGQAAGVAVNHSAGQVYVADAALKRLYFLNASTLSFTFGGNTGNLAPTGSTAQYLGVDTVTNRLLVTDNLAGTVYFYDTSSGTYMTSPGNLSVTAQCSASSLSYAVVNSSLHMGYVLCGSKIIYFNTGTSPTFGVGGSLVSSTFNLAPITTAQDLVVGKSSTVVVVGNQYVLILNGQTGTTVAAADLGATCGGTPDLRGVTYDSSSSTLYVSDFANNKVYLLKDTDGTPKTGNCATSSFSTSADVPNPAKMSFF